MVEDRSIAQRSKQPGDARERETFLEVQEILKRVLDSLREVRRRLEELRVRDERTRLFVDALVTQRRDLERAIDEGMLDVPGEILDTFVQYGVDPCVDVPDLQGSDAPEEVVRWQNACDEALSATLLDLSKRLESPDPKELVESVVRLLGAHDRRVALELQELRDV